MKPLGTNNAAENALTTPKSAFVPTISQCGGSTKSLKPREFSTPEKTSFQRVNRLLYKQTQQAGFQQKNTTWLTHKSPHQRTNQPLKRCQFWIFTTLVNTEIERRYDNLDFDLLPLDLAI
jgi:rRNA maturation protein Nop10